ncbi:GATA transcription factor 6-like [Lycium barbarum]|uniref:GATA transcription factor 6-like n=1 Tax=Lycium barbarum TaxID=112863 RepID=UPI00293E4F9F|nr:GATA transcription factor 6-like [Lycium barbarum]XP_060194489.1 GATA transcription factor 6-like [Lycium barbarum]XP_060194490.1 GATA transcription factor 6-like [Lycium barbarum]
MDKLGSSGDDLFVDDLLDFSNDFPDDDDQGHENNNYLSPQKLQPQDKESDKVTLTNKSSLIPSEKEDFDSILGSQLSLPGGDLDNLEWLSHFVEDSFSEYSLTYLPEKALQIHSNTQNPVQQQSCFTSRVQNKPPAKKPKKKMEKRVGFGAKQCSHCGVQKTPLWRTGPLGEKTLCNACGVRFKSGRLLPEYRPASSPTFSNGLHSNSHRKVLEMRHKKEIGAGSSDFLKD